jgi:hypothetical protein
VHSVDTPFRLATVSARARRTLGLTAAALFAFAGPPAVVAGVPTSIIECGQIVAYTAPDPVTPADGSLTIGLLTPWTINADALIGANAASVLQSFAGSGPSCIALELDGSDRVTALEIAPSGSVHGDVVFDSGSGWYLFDDRLLVPTFITDANPGLAAVFATSEAEGTPVSATFNVDVTTGGFTGVSASASFCGPADLDGDGNGLVGDAVIPAAVLDADSTDDLDRADGHQRCADIETEGTVGQELELTTSVDIYSRAPAPDPPDTAADAREPVDPAVAAGSPQDLIGLLIALFVGGIARLARQPRPTTITGERPRAI